MKTCVFLIATLLKIILVENKENGKIMALPMELEETYGVEEGDETDGVKGSQQKESIEESSVESDGSLTNEQGKRCSVVVLPNMQNPNMQTLLRKYRYDTNGLLIPGSVKYYLKIPQGDLPPILLPLKDRTISPLGGFVRYYKEVPSIPHLWQQ